MIRVYTLIAGILALVGFAMQPARAQQAVFGGEMPVHTDNASEQIDALHPLAVQTARDLRNGTAAPDALNRNALQSLVFPLRVRPGARGASHFGISNFVDLDSTTALQDWNCGTRTYDGHRGNDLYGAPYSWLGMDTMDNEIVAAAAGTIVQRQDGQFDRQCIPLGTTTNPPVNYIAVAQDDGAFAYYLHMKNGSVTARQVGERVAAGERLGTVGSSGRSSGPHLHFELRDDVGATIDAFAGTCNAGRSLWKHQWKAQRDTRLTQVASHAAAPVGSPSCGVQETPNYSDLFNPGQTVYSAIYLRDQGVGDTAVVSLINPSGTVVATFPTGDGTACGGLCRTSYWYMTYALPGNAPAGTWKVRGTIAGRTMEHSFQVTNAIAQASVLSALLPGSRSVVRGTAATLFSTMLNTSAQPAVGCWIQPETPLDAAFSFQTTNAANQLTGTPNTNVTIPANGAQNFLLALTPSATALKSESTPVTFRFKCTNTDGAPTFDYVNTFLLSFDSVSTPDIIPISLSPSGDGIVHIPGASGTGFFVASAVNIGAGATLTVRPVLQSPVTAQLTVCDTTGQIGGACIGQPTATVSRAFAPNVATTFTVLVVGSGNVPFDPAVNRIRLEFVDAGGVIRGQTNLAVRTN